MKKNKLIYIILIIAIIIMLILGYMVINKNAVIKDQQKEIELKIMEINGSNSYILTSDHFSKTPKVWNKTYAYSDYTWSGIARSTSSYTALTNSSNTTATITVNLPDSDVIDSKRIQGWTIRFWTSDTTSSTEDNGNQFRSARGSSQYWFEYPVFNAVCDDPDAYSFSRHGQVKKKVRNYVTGIPGENNYQIVDAQTISSGWGRYGSNDSVQPGNPNMEFYYDSTNKTMKFYFKYIDNNIYATKGYPVMDVTIYYI